MKHITSALALMLIVGTAYAQPVIDCLSDVEIPIDSVSCQGVMTDLSFLVTNDDGSFTITQNPSFGSPVDGGFNHQVDVTITATDGSGNTESCTITVDLVPPAPPLPQDYWIAYCYNGKIILGEDVYRGYYIENDLDISSWQLWDIGVSPSWYSEYNGCPVNLNQHSVAYRRQGFPCGNYQFDILNHDNEVRLYVDGAEVFAHDGYNLEHLDVHQAFLDASTQVEFQWNEGIGGSIGIMDLILQCPEDTLLYLDENCTAPIPDYRWAACPGGEVTQNITPGTELTVGSHELIMTTSDATGWVETCTTTVVVADTSAPAFTCLGTLERSLNSACEYIVEDFASTLGITDNCDPNPSITQDIAPGTVVTSDISITITAADITGNSTTCSFLVSVVDDTPPAINCLADQNESYDGDCEFTLPDYALSIVATDNCSGSVSISQTPAAGTLLTGVSDQLITITATDDEGNFSTCEFTLNLSDAEVPTISCPSDSTLFLDSNCEAQVPDFLSIATWNDNCLSTLVVEQSPLAGTPITSPGSTTVTLSATDVGGNVTTCSLELIVEDATPPVVACPGNQTVLADAGCSFVLPDYASEIAISDNCGGSFNTMQVPTAGSVVVGNQTVTLTVVDSWGNFNVCTFDVFVEDQTAPDLICPNDITLELSADCSFSYPDLVAGASVLDNCDTPSISQSIPAGQIGSGAGVWPVELSATDLAGNTSTCTANVITVDLSAPTFTCPEDQALVLDVNCEWVVPDYGASIAVLDNCDPSPTANQSPSPGTILTGPGDQEIDLTFTDASGNSSSCTFVITLVDGDSPVVSVPTTLSKSLDADCSYTLEDLTDELTITDNCSTTWTIVQNPATGEQLTGVDSSHTITFEVTDESGNMTSVSTELTLVDSTPAEIDCPENIAVSLGAGCFYVLEDFTVGLEVTDACSSSLSITQTPEPGELYTEVSTVPIVFEAVDESGNTTTCSTVLNISDTIAPTLFCLEDLTFNPNADCTFELPDLTGNAVAADNCDPDFSLEQSPAPGSILDGSQAEHPITISATDASGNQSSCSFTIFLTDSIAPEITCPEPFDIEVNQLCGGQVPDLLDQVVVTNNCNESFFVTQNPIPGTEFSGAGLTGNITFTAEDEYGNTSSCTSTITLVDYVPPQMTCTDQEFILPQGECSMTINYQLPYVIDNCTETSLTHVDGPMVGQLFALGSHEVTYMAEDQSGNSSECTFTITVIDHEDPVIACPEDFLISLPEDNCLVDLEFDFATADDNCDAVSIEIISGPEPGESVAAGIHTVEFEATDSSGNSATCTANFTVEDLIPPSIDCPAPMTFTNDEGECGAYIDFLPTVIDNCGEVTLEYLEGPEPGGFFPLGETLVSIEATDGSGNSSGCSFIVEVIDDEAPTIECQWDIITSNPLVIYNPPVVHENCDVYSMEVIQGYPSGSVFPFGTTTVELMAIDPADNFSTCTFTVYVNQGPTAVPDIIETHQRQINFFPLHNDVDPEDDHLYIESVEMVPNLRLEIDGSMTYFPDHETCQGDSIAYTIKDTHGITSTSYIKIDVVCPDLVDIPEAFSPNDDGVNDFLTIAGIEDFPGCKLTVFSEWGNIVYQVSDYQNDWDGTANKGWLRNEEKLPEAKYYYVLEMPYNSIIKKGTIYLKH